jgi:hypothetical protein
MRAARQVEPRPDGDRGAKPYGVTDWTRQAVAPLVAAGRCECEHLAEATDPLTRIDIEAAFLLSVPLVDLEVTRSGSCLLAVDTGIVRNSDASDRLAGVYVEIEQGGVISCSSRLEQDPRTWAVGSIGAWVSAILEDDRDRLRLGGKDPKIADDLIARLHGSLQ